MFETGGVLDTQAAISNKATCNVNVQLQFLRLSSMHSGLHLVSRQLHVHCDMHVPVHLGYQ